LPSIKFNRNYRLSIDLNDGQDEIVIQPPMTIEFNISRAANAQINLMNLSIYNLKDSTRQRIFQDRYRIKDYKRVTLEAGYGDELNVIYQGSIYQARSVLSGSEVRTDIISRDGGFDYPTAQINQTFEAGTTLKDVLGGIIDTFQFLKRGDIGGEDYTFQRSVTVEGNSSEQLRKYSRGDAYTDLEKVSILSPNQITNDPVFLFNSDTGLLETPEREDSVLTITTLFEPRVNMGQIVEIESRVSPIYNGQYKVQGVTHSGTISEGVGGTLISKFNLFIGTQVFGRFKKVGSE